MINKQSAKAGGFNLIELLLVVSIVGFLTISVVTVFSMAKMNNRDAVRAESVAAVKRALAVYFKDSLTSYPASTGECLKADLGVGRELTEAKVLPSVLVDPLWPAKAPTDAKPNDGVPDEGQNNFCYFYYSGASDQFKISFFMESNSKVGRVGINTVVQ